MISSFHDLPFFHDYDIISLLHGLESMRDDDHGPSLEEAIECECDSFF